VAAKKISAEAEAELKKSTGKGGAAKSTAAKASEAKVAESLE